MHPTETGKHNTIYNVIGTPTHPLHTLKMISLLYSRDLIFDDVNSREATGVIKDFLFSKGFYKTISEWEIKLTVCHVSRLCSTFEHKIANELSIRQREVVCLYVLRIIIKRTLGQCVGVCISTLTAILMSYCFNELVM